MGRAYFFSAATCLNIRDWSIALLRVRYRSFLYSFVVWTVEDVWANLPGEGGWGLVGAVHVLEDGRPVLVVRDNYKLDCRGCAGQLTRGGRPGPRRSRPCPRRPGRTWPRSGPIGRSPSTPHLGWCGRKADGGAPPPETPPARSAPSSAPSPATEDRRELSVKPLTSHFTT
eukprot:1194512-Prorocentrum_minimum.AAC.5